MNREIKFRAWDKENQKWNIAWSTFFPWGTHSEDKTKVVLGIMPNYFEFNQFTGLKDKNGQDIYEGDIVAFQEYPEKLGYKVHNWVVYYDNTVAMFRLKWLPWFIKSYNGNFGSTKHFRRDGIYYQVIGNIYENPELL